MDEKKPYQDKNWLYKEYMEKRKTIEEIAEEQGCTQGNIVYFLRKFRIKKKRKGRKTEEGKTTYDLALRIGKHLGMTEGQIWHRIHKIEAKHGLYDIENLTYSSEVQGYVRKTVTVSSDTMKAIREWIYDSIRNIYTKRDGLQPRLRKLAEREGIPFNILFNVLRAGNRRLKPGSDVYKALKGLCERHDILWEEV